ncbi:MAG: hypothetical protein Q7S65_00140 [Nanoarchaeota archaeon]|nr:hypothetical protein [Nanoarchaeota archaeon]
MAVKQILPDQFTIERPGFERVFFTQSSRRQYVGPSYDGVRMWEARKFMWRTSGSQDALPSVREEAAYRVEAYAPEWARSEGAMNSLTRTANLYFMNRGKVYVAVDDKMKRYLKQFEKETGEHGKQKLYKGNLIMRCSVDQMAKTFWENNQWTAERREVRDVLEKAADLGRVYRLTDRVREFDLKSSGGVEAFAADKAVRAYFGDLAEEYARMGAIETAEIRLLEPRKGSYRQAPENFEENLADGKVVIRAVTLGGLRSPGVHDDYNFEERALARIIFHPDYHRPLEFPSQKK